MADVAAGEERRIVVAVDESEEGRRGEEDSGGGGRERGEPPRPPVIKVEVKECCGDARDVICDMVEKLGADVLVMGSHGHGFIKRALMGSVSSHCAQNAKCPVVIVKRPA
ncbi:uncharacterized protein A4U43_C07F12280 [Asparagus officinalis]|uniref:UspA domain-containing protein n=1 Tax=Asparagus officinalis TaxID=4686 RepID=A0A5P1EBC3_ASPOF|nr:uncharacterized protein A4U43_C07F12280 [Asparagus officinalis]